MPAILTPIEVASGFVKDDTKLAAQGAYIDGNNFRFRQGRPQMRRGRELVTTDTFSGIVRGSRAWADLSGQPQALFGTANALNAYSGGAIVDVTGPHSEGILYDLAGVVTNKSSNYTVIASDSGNLLYVPRGTATFTFTLTAATTLGRTFTVYIRNYSLSNMSLAPTGTDQINGLNASTTIEAGTAIYIECDGTSFTTTLQAAEGPISTVSGSTTVTINAPEHGLIVDQNVTISNAMAVGGITLSGVYPVVAVNSRNQYTITAGSAASSTATGGGFDFVAEWLETGLVDGTGGIGYGTGTYGTGTYGLPSVSDYLPATWSIWPFGEVGLALRRGGPLYAWQPAASYDDIIVDDDFGSGTGWSAAGRILTATSGTASNCSQNVEAVIRSGYTYRADFTVNRTSGSGVIKLQTNSGDPAAVIDAGAASAPITVNGTYSRLIVMPAGTVDILFAKDANWAGSVTWISLTLEDKAFMIEEAPRKSYVMSVDAQAIVHLGGTYEQDGDFNPMCHRTSGVANFRDWVSSTESLASEYPLTGGGRIMQILQGRGQIGIWTDTGFISAQYKGTVGDAFSHTPRGSGCGLIGANAAIEHSGMFFWLSNNGNPYIYQGAVAQIIECRDRQDLFNNIAPSQGEKIQAFVDVEFSEIGWMIPDNRDGSECSRAVCYQYLENHFYGTMFPYSGYIPQGIFTNPMGFGTDGKIYYEGLGSTDNGGTRSGYLLTSIFGIQNGDILTNLTGMQVDFMDENEEQGFSGSCRLIVYGYDRPKSTARTLADETFTSSKEVVWFRGKARFVQIRIEFSGLPCYARFGIAGFYIGQSGAKR